MSDINFYKDYYNNSEELLKFHRKVTYRVLSDLSLLDALVHSFVCATFETDMRDDQICKLNAMKEKGIK